MLILGQWCYYAGTGPTFYCTLPLFLGCKEPFRILSGRLSEWRVCGECGHVAALLVVTLLVVTLLVVTLLVVTLLVVTLLVVVGLSVALFLVHV